MQACGRARGLGLHSCDYWIKAGHFTMVERTLAFSYWEAKVLAFRICIPPATVALLTVLLSFQTAQASPDCASATISSANPKFPFQCHHQQIIDQHQDGLVEVAVNADGGGVANFRFSNGKRFFASEKFSAEAAFETSTGKMLLVVRKSVPLDGSWGGPSNVTSSAIHFKLTDKKLAAFDHVVVPQMHADSKTTWSIQIGPPPKNTDNSEELSLGPPDVLTSDEPPRPKSRPPPPTNPRRL
jgi:hypothetical protein